MAGMKVVVVKASADGSVDLDDLRTKITTHHDELAAIMVTYPSTHGVFEADIVELCDLVHEAGGQVYVDGANLNALLGLARPGKFGADVSHLNLHKTFCIPHGGGGPGVGPVGVGAHLAPFLPGHPFFESADGIGPISAAPFGSAGILPISYAYIAMMGADGLTEATQHALLAANYIAQRLHDHFPVLYSGRNGRVAHECIIDLRPLTKASGISVDDVAKRLIDYGFHAPTMSFPVAGTFMVEPTESENLEELDRFCDAMINIRAEIAKVESGEWPRGDNPLVNAPHTQGQVTADEWEHPYSRRVAAFPAGLHAGPLYADGFDKYWPPVGRIDGGFGDRNLVCTCPPPEAFEIGRSARRLRAQRTRSTEIRAIPGRLRAQRPRLTLHAARSVSICSLRSPRIALVAAYFVVARRRKACRLTPPQHGGARSGFNWLAPLAADRARSRLLRRRSPTKSVSAHSSSARRRAIRVASSMSSCVRPPSEWVDSTKVTLFQRMSMSG